MLYHVLTSLCIVYKVCCAVDISRAWLSAAAAFLTLVCKMQFHNIRISNQSSKAHAKHYWCNLQEVSLQWANTLEALHQIRYLPFDSSTALGSSESLSTCLVCLWSWNVWLSAWKQYLATANQSTTMYHSHILMYLSSLQCGFVQQASLVTVR